MKAKALILALCLLSSSVLAGEVGITKNPPAPFSPEVIEPDNTSNAPGHIRNLYLDFWQYRGGNLAPVRGTGITQWGRPNDGNLSNILNSVTGRRSNTNSEFQLAMIVFGSDLANHIFRGRKHTGYYKAMFSNLKHAADALLKHGESSSIGDEIGWFNPATKHYGGLRIDAETQSQSGLPCIHFSIVLHLGNSTEHSTSVACHLNNNWFFNYVD